jgi:hypothetical protein
LRLQELTRRPFFAAVLAGLSATAGIATEVDLADAWWKGGGYDALSDRVGPRQRTLIKLAQEGGQTLGRKVSIKECDPSAVDELRRDGVVREVSSGHTVRFSHDIYYEWAFLHLLIDRESDWTDELRNAGEPPVLGRVVELLSQLEYREKESWEPDLRALEQSDLRPQWARAWLLGPFASPSFEEDQDQMSIAVFANGAARLTKLAVWFQAEKTKPNPLVLQRAGSQNAVDTVRAADALAWPSDVKAWSRLIGWILADPTRLPYAAAGDIVSVFEVWQHMLADTCNTRSSMVLTVVFNWLEDLEDRLHSETFSTEYGPWEEDSERLKELEKRLRAIALRAGRAYPKRVCVYVERLRSRARLRGDALGEVLIYAPILAEVGPALLVDYVLDETLNELPEVVAAQPIEADHFFVPRINYHDWHTLSIGRAARAFNVASPVAQPFVALFTTAPVEALRLVRRLCNHAISAWRQLHALKIDGSRRPIPLTLEFPWGLQTFWGDHRVYLRPRTQVDREPGDF